MRIRREVGLDEVVTASDSAEARLLELCERAAVPPEADRAWVDDW